MEITIFDPATGAILKVVSGTNEADVLANVKPGQDFINGVADGSEQWINPQTRRRRKLQAMTARVVDNRILGLPPFAVATIKGDRFTADESGSIDLAGELDLHEDVTADVSAPGFTPEQLKVPLRSGGTGAPVAQHFETVRRAAYESEGVTIEALLVALIEERDGDPTALNELLEKRRAVRARVPSKQKR